MHLGKREYLTAGNPAGRGRAPGIVRAFAAFLCLLIGGCAHGPMALPASTSLSVGEWHGVTSQGKQIAFTVSSDETVSDITIGFDCLGTLAFHKLAIPTAPSVTCLPGPCRGTLNSYRAFSFVDSPTSGRPDLQINGLFLPRNRAQGQAVFSGTFECDAATVQWTAARS